MNTIKWVSRTVVCDPLSQGSRQIARLVRKARPPRERKYLASAWRLITSDLAATRIRAHCPTGQPKHYYSGFDQKMIGARPRLRGHLRPRRSAGPGGVGARLLCGPRVRCTRAGTLCPGVSRTTSRCPSPTCTSRCTTTVGVRREAGRDPDPYAQRASPGRVRRGCPLEVQGDARSVRSCQRRARRRARAGTTWRGCASQSTGRRRPPTRGSSSTRCAEISAQEVYVFTLAKRGL